MRPTVIALCFPIMALAGNLTDRPGQAALPPPPPDSVAIRAFLREGENVEEARRMYREGCARNEAAACAGLGAIVAREKGLEAAREPLAKACRLGDGYGCYRIAEISSGQARVRALREACRARIGIACLEWGLAAGNDRSLAREAFESGCRIGEPGACSELALLEAETGNLARARELLEPVCRKSPALGCNNLGLIEWRHGDAKRARSLFRQACDRGADAMACNSLGAMERADGNVGEAKRLYRLACDRGAEMGCRNLAALDSSRAKK